MRIPLSPFTIIWALYIWTSAFYMRQVLTIFYNTIGRGYLSIAVALLFCVGALYVIKDMMASSLIRRVTIVVLLLFVTSYALTLQMPEERAHLVVFAVMGWTLSRDVSALPFPQRFIIAALGVGIVAIIDEGLQWFIPWRVCDIRDVGFDCIGGLAGIFMFNPKRSN